MKKLLSVVICLSLLCLAACTESKPVEDGSEESASVQEASENVMVYISGSEGMIDKLEEAFEEKNGDVIDMLKMSCGQVRSKVWTEKEAGQIQADVVFGSDPLIYNILDDEGLLEAVQLTEPEAIKDKYIPVDRDYILVNERYVTIMYNKKQFKDTEIPKSFEDLKNEAYKGKITLADANQSSTALGITCALYQLKGESMNYFEKLHGNEVFLTKSNGQIPSKIMEGEFDLGVGPHDSVVRLKKKAKKDGYEMPVAIVWPEEGALAIQRPMAIIKNDNRSEEKEEIAQKFLNFMVSKEAQIITDQFGFVSVRKDIENKYLPAEAKVHKINWEKASENESHIKQAYQEVFHN